MGRRPEVWTAVYLQPFPEDMSQSCDAVSFAGSEAMPLLISAAFNTKMVHSLNRS